MIRLDLAAFAAMDRCLSLKKFNEEDHPRADDGEFTSGGGGGSSGGRGGDHGGDVGDDYQDADHAAHASAMKDLDRHVAGLNHALNDGSAVFHNASASADQVVAAAEKIAKHYDAAAAAHDKVNAIRSEYGDENEDVPILLSHEDLRSAIDDLNASLKTVRGETASRARQNAESERQLAESDPIAHLSRALDAALHKVISR